MRAGGIAAEIAPAKINLTLRVGGKRPDGYHNIESLVAFADLHDALRLTPAADLSLKVDGPFVLQSGPADDNLVLKAARLFARQVPGLQIGHFDLTKNLPAAAPPLEKLSEPSLASWLAGEANELESAAISLQGVIEDVLADLRSAAGCKLARMSGSGANCFGLFDAAGAAATAHALHRRHPDWWVRAAVLSEDLNANSNA